MILLRMFLSSLLFFLNPVPSQRDQILNKDQFEPGQWNTYICFELLTVKITLDDIHLNVFALATILTNQMQDFSLS